MIYCARPPRHASNKLLQHAMYSTTECCSLQVQQHVDDAISKGAKALTGGSTPDLSAPYDNGNFFQPTVLADCSTDMKVSTTVCNALFVWLQKHVQAVLCACGCHAINQVHNSWQFGSGTAACLICPGHETVVDAPV